MANISFSTLPLRVIFDQIALPDWNIYNGLYHKPFFIPPFSRIWVHAPLPMPLARVFISATTPHPYTHAAKVTQILYRLSSGHIFARKFHGTGKLIARVGGVNLHRIMSGICIRHGEDEIFKTITRKLRPLEVEDSQVAIWE